MQGLKILVIFCAALGAGVIAKQMASEATSQSMKDAQDAAQKNFAGAPWQAPAPPPTFPTQGTWNPVQPKSSPPRVNMSLPPGKK